MNRILLAAPLLALSLSACETYDQGQNGGGPYESSGYPQPYPPQPYPPQPFPPQSYPQPYPTYPQPYPQGSFPDGLSNPGSGAASVLAQSEWRVTLINGRPVPPGQFVNFRPDRIEAKFGCNALGAGYSVQGEYVTAGALMATRMACADMSFETAGSNILAQPMRVDLRDSQRLVLTNAAGSIEALRTR